MRDREVAVWDTRALATPLVREALDTAPGLLLPLFDPDTNMLFLAGKVRPSIRTEARSATYARTIPMSAAWTPAYMGH
jgi:hypothetical protein